ncbi:MAG: substrate-binding domain-containing protein [Veillonellales bacterium]
MAITINDVAAKAGVSKSTVSRYLNGRYECMSLGTKEKITQVIAELDYHPNAVARSLKQKSTKTIGAIVANILNPFSTSIVRGVEDYCKQSGFNLILCNADDDPVKEKEYITMLMTKQIDGLMINTTGHNNALLQGVTQQIPVVLIDRKVAAIKADTVTADSCRGAYLAVRHLIGLGHTRIALLALPCANISPRLERVQGYKQALTDCGLPVDERLVVETCTAQAVVLERIKQLLAMNPRPTALFGVNNLMTMSIIKALKKLAIPIPADMAVIGFDDWEWAELLEPPVTVIAQPTYDMGKKAGELLLKRIKSGRAGKRPSVIVYPPALVVRKSCGET